MRVFSLSASSINALKACPQRFRLGYREGIRKLEDTDAQRVGTTWHEAHEAYAEAKENKLETALGFIDGVYTDTEIPSWKTKEEWETERAMIVYSFSAYTTYWEEDEVEPLANELGFNLPVHAPRTGLPLPLEQVKRVGKIDQVGVWKGKIVNVERKSTTRSIDPSGDYWAKLDKDVQVSMYALAFRDMIDSETLPDNITNHEAYDVDNIGNTVYDVWHKATMKPKKLTQKDSQEFIDQGEYFGVDFEVVGTVEDEKTNTLTVDGEEAELTFGKKGQPVIRETSSMFGARLYSDMMERPEFYFQRQEIARTDQELRDFRVELFNIYQAQKMFVRHGFWYENEQQCAATFKCAYIPICYGEGANNVCDGKTVPDGFRRYYKLTTKETENE